VAWMRWAEVFVWLYNYPTAFQHQRFLLALTYCRRPFTTQLSARLAFTSLSACALCVVCVSCVPCDKCVVCRVVSCARHACHG
jgi:hypothetical protein